jgi:hypothetical protein
MAGWIRRPFGAPGLTQVKVAQMKVDNIRFVTRGLGPYAAAEFGEISSEDPQSAAIDDVADLAEGIADMATSLTAHGLTRPAR